jgi:hypothetical protein
MNRGKDYEWESTRDLPERGMICGHCGGDITSKTGYTGWLAITGVRLRQDLYICHKCGLPTFIGVTGSQSPTFKIGSTTFPEAIEGISSNFAKIYNQSEIAEACDLNEIVGTGYGKALEFLVKDYLIKVLPERAEEIKDKKLYLCINELIDNPKIKILTEKARLIRNNEIHYVRKDEQSDINDLKKLISATVAWIELELFTSDVANNA